MTAAPCRTACGRCRLLQLGCVLRVVNTQAGRIHAAAAAVHSTAASGSGSAGTSVTYSYSSRSASPNSNRTSPAMAAAPASAFKDYLRDCRASLPAVAAAPEAAPRVDAKACSKVRFSEHHAPRPRSDVRLAAAIFVQAHARAAARRKLATTPAHVMCTTPLRPPPCLWPHHGCRPCACARA